MDAAPPTQAARALLCRAAAVLALAVAVAGAAPVAAAGSPATDSVATLLADYAAKSRFAAPALDVDEIAALDDGEVLVKMSATPSAEVDDEITAMGLYAFKVIEAPRLLLWLSVMGGNDERDYRLTRATLERDAPGSYVRYQHVDLPWPVRDRHWVIDCSKNTALAQASDGVVWEHLWDLHADGPAMLDAAMDAGRIPRLSREELRESVYLPANRGAWTLIDAGPQRTLVIAWVDADLGGSFPDLLVRTFTKRRLKAGMALLEDMAARVHLNYSAAPPIHDGHGREISRDAALQAARSWRAVAQVASAAR